MVLVLMDALLSLVPYALLAVLVPVLLRTYVPSLTTEVVASFRTTLAIYAGLLLVTWFSSAPQLTLFTGIFSLVVLARLAHEVFTAEPRAARERRWLWLTIAGYVGLAAVPTLFPATEIQQFLIYGFANLIGTLLAVGAWVMHANLSAAGKGRLLALAANTCAMMLVTVSFLAWELFAA